MYALILVACLNGAPNDCIRTVLTDQFTNMIGCMTGGQPVAQQYMRQFPRHHIERLICDVPERIAHHLGKDRV